MKFDDFIQMLYQLKRSGWYAIPTKRMRKSIFIKNSLRRWALSEIILYSEEKYKLNWDPIYTMEQFCKMVDDFACVEKKDDLNENITYCFSIAYDVGMEILDMLMVK